MDTLSPDEQNLLTLAAELGFVILAESIANGSSSEKLLASEPGVSRDKTFSQLT